MHNVLSGPGNASLLLDAGHVDNFPFSISTIVVGDLATLEKKGLDEVVWFIEAIVIHQESLLQEPERRGAEAQEQRIINHA